MRLWHVELLEVLPEKHLRQQLRDCVTLVENWDNEKSRLKNNLEVNYIFEEDKVKFNVYSEKVLKAHEARDILVTAKVSDRLKIDEKEVEKYKKEFPKSNYKQHNKRYMKQCFYKLEEECDYGLLESEDFYPVVTLYAQKKGVINERDTYYIKGRKPSFEEVEGIMEKARKDNSLVIPPLHYDGRPFTFVRALSKLSDEYFDKTMEELLKKVK